MMPSFPDSGMQLGMRCGGHHCDSGNTALQLEKQVKSFGCSCAHLFQCLLRVLFCFLSIELVEGHMFLQGAVHLFLHVPE